MPQPLPNNPYVAGTPAHQAHATCLALEAGMTLANWSGPPTPVCARLLGYMIIHSPTNEGRSNIVTEINSCLDDDVKLHELAKFYVWHYLRCSRQNKGRTPIPSGHVSRPSFDAMQENLKYLLEEPPKDYRDAKDAALLRDGYRCVITGYVDAASADEFPNQLAAAGAAHGQRLTQCAHILVPSTSQDISGTNVDSQKHNYAASAWAVVMRTGNVLVPDELNSANIHRLENVMTMEQGVHGMFDCLALWLETTNVPDQYMLQARKPGFLVNLPATVTFTSTRAHLPLPDPRYLALHAACAKVAFLSGAGEYIETVDRDIYTTKVLANDGSSMNLLEAAMTRTRYFPCDPP